MLRVWKPQSPMSVGAWTLTAFGTAASATAFAELLDRRGIAPVKVIADAAGMLAATTGLAMATYTGVLVGATTSRRGTAASRCCRCTSPPPASAPRCRCSSCWGTTSRALNRLGIAAALVEMATASSTSSTTIPAHAPLKQGSSGALVRAGGVLSGAGCRCCSALRRPQAAARWRARRLVADPLRLGGGGHAVRATTQGAARARSPVSRSSTHIAATAEAGPP
jgi:hypothetical protein